MYSRDTIVSLERQRSGRGVWDAECGMCVCVWGGGAVDRRFALAELGGRWDQAPATKVLFS